MAMEKFRHQPLPQPQRDFDQEHIRQLMRVLEIYFTQLDSLTPNQAESYRADNFFGGFFVGGVSPSVTATGTTQVTAVELISAVNNVSTVAAGETGVLLPVAVPGVRVLVRNSDATTTLNIYPASGAQINALAANTALTLAAGETIELFAISATQWYSF